MLLGVGDVEVVEVEGVVALNGPLMLLLEEEEERARELRVSAE